MSEPVSNSQSSGIGFLGLLTIVFITLKLTGHIDWSWWWVWLPLYGPIAAVLALCGLIVAVSVVADLANWGYKKWRK